MSDAATIIDSVPCMVLDREAVISVEAGMAVVRVAGKGTSAVYLGMPPEHALRIGAAFIRAGLKIDPSLAMSAIEAELRESGKPVALVAKAEGEAS